MAEKEEAETVKQEEELGRIKKNDTTDIVLRKSEFRNQVGLDIREYVKTETYTGPTKRGVRIPIDKVGELKDILSKA